MRLINQSKNIILAEEVFLADTPLKRIKGLLGRKDFPAGQALIIRPCNSIHTFFMRFPIDVLFVTKDDQVLQAISSLKPFRITKIYFQAHYVIELPSGTLQNSVTSQGDLLAYLIRPGL